jgi:WD40 repeat protein
MSWSLDAQMSIFDPLNEVNPLRDATRNFAAQDAASADSQARHFSLKDAIPAGGYECRCFGACSPNVDSLCLSVTPRRDSRFCRMIPNFLSADECTALKGRMAQVSRADSDYPPSYRNNQRIVFEDGALARQLSDRLRTRLGGDLEFPDAQFLGINPRWRGCRYNVGERFNLHQDGVFHVDHETRSRLTFMIYLDDASDFCGGDTEFYEGGPGTPGAQQLIARVRPQLGALIVFDHALWHAGAEVSAGMKHILRSDLLYRDRASNSTSTAHQGYVFTLAHLGDNDYASGGRDGSIRLWQSAQDRLQAVLKVHQQSVLKVIALAGQRLAAISRDRSFSIWHWPSAQLLAHEMGAFAATPLDLIALAGNDLLISDASGALSRWRLTPQRVTCVQRQSFEHGWIWSLRALTDGSFLMACEDGSCLHLDAHLEVLSLIQLGAPLRCVAVNASPNAGTSRYFCADHAGFIHVLALNSGQLVRQHFWRAHDAAIRCLDFDARGLLCSGGEDNRLRFCSVSPVGESDDVYITTSAMAEINANSFVCAAIAQVDAVKIATYSGLQSHPLSLAGSPPVLSPPVLLPPVISRAVISRAVTSPNRHASIHVAPPTLSGGQ